MTHKIKIEEEHIQEAWTWCFKYLKTNRWRVWYRFLSDTHSVFEFDSEKDYILFKLVFHHACE